MKIAEETGDGDMKEQAKVNFGMANASMKWNTHITNILQNIEKNEKANNAIEDQDENMDEEEEDDGQRLPDINKRQ